MLANTLEKQMRATFGESAEDIIEGVWREIRLLNEKLPNRALEALREKELALHANDKGLPEAKKKFGKYFEAPEKIADLLKAAARELVEEAEKEKKGSVKWIKGKPYIAYEGPVELSARTEHMEKDGKKYAVIEAKYGEKTARAEVEVEELKRAGLDIEGLKRFGPLANLAAIATDDKREFYGGYVSHGTASFVQAAERFLMWALFMPGEYKITVRYVYATEEGLSPEIEIESRFGPGGVEKIENDPIHRLVLRLARELAGGENLNEVKGAANKVLAASWLLASAILNAPEGGRPSEGLAVLAKKGVLPRAAFDRLRPIFEELDALLGPISRADKAYLVGKIVDYDGSVDKGLLKVGAKKIKEMIELDGVEINIADVAEAAAKAFWKEGRWSGNYLYFGPAKDVPELDDVPTLKYFAMLMGQKTHKEAKELRQKDLVSRVELAMYEGSEAKFKIIAAKAREGERAPITRKNLEKIWKGFKDGKFTHLRLVVGGEECELSSISESGSSGSGNVRFTIGGEEAQKLADALKELSLEDVEPTPSGYLYLYREDLEALLSKGVEAYAVRKAKKGEAMWRVEITGKGRTIALEMTYIERQNRLQKGSSTGKIEVFVYEEGATKGEWVKLDLDLLAAIREGQDCGNCLEKRLAEALNDVTSKNPGFKWSVTGGGRKYLCVYLPSDFKDAVRRLK